MSLPRPHFLADRLRKGIGTSLSQASHQRTRRAAFERYSAIRRFFKQQNQHVPSLKNASNPVFIGYRVSYGEPFLTRSTFYLARTSARALHTTSVLLKQGQPSQAPRPLTSSDATIHGRVSDESHRDAKHEAEEIEDNSRVPNHLDNYPAFLRRLAMSVPNIPKPTRDDLLTVADGFWQRTRIRFRWFTIKSFRRFNADDISAFVTWFLMSQTIWILVGTTTFFSVVFAIANSLRLQEYIARALSNYLTAETGAKIIFESAIVPKWKDSRISFKNVYIVRRPTVPENKPQSGLQATAIGYDISSHPLVHGSGEEEEELHLPDFSEEDTNYTQFDLTIDSVDVTLSLWRWLDGKGLVEDAVIKGVRGVLDRREVTWDPDHPFDPALFRHRAQPGDFELESLQLEDVLVTVYQPGCFRPYTASIFRADIRTFRKQWMFYDFLSAENIVGQFDNCLFSLHKPQSIGRTNEQDLLDGKWARMSRFRIDGVNIDHIQAATTEGGPMSWIKSGKVDAVLDIKFPHDTEEDVFDAILGEIADAITTATTSLALSDRIPGQRQLAKPPLTAPSDAEDDEQSQKGRSLIIDIDLRFRDLKAAVPIFTNDLSYVNNAAVRPIVAFMNANRTLIPIHCRVITSIDNFDGSWTMWETGLMDSIAIKVYDAMAFHVSNQANTPHRVRTVGIWSLQMTTSALLSTLRTLVDPLALRLREIYTDPSSFDLAYI